MINNISKFDSSSLKRISESKIYFGHQSVGYNIIAGIKDLTDKYNHIKLKIVESISLNDFQEPVFAHSAIGANEDPKSKVDSFIHILKSGLGKKVDVAFFKFCYVDIVNSTDIKFIFNYYKDKMNSLQKEFPNVKFIHVTVPLTTDDKMYFGFTNRLKFYIKRLLDRDIGEGINIEDNIKRNLFNEMLIKEYKDSVFDLAKFESTLMDDKRNQNVKNNLIYYSLVKDYTFDGGHLNKKGRIFIAFKLLEYLVNFN